MATDIETRGRILECARERFLQQGFSKVTVDEIAAELGISKKTLYKFYPSKEELLRAAVHMTMHAVEQAMEQIVSSNKPLEEKLVEVMLMIGRHIGKLTPTGVVDLQRFAPELWQELDEFRSKYMSSKLSRILAQARAEKILRGEIADQLLIQMIISSVRGTVNPEFLSQNPFTAQDALESIFSVIFQGALTDDARRNFHLFDKALKQHIIA